MTRHEPEAQPPPRWLALAAQRLRMVRAPESLRARIIAMLAVERQFPGTSEEPHR
jgi:hypothetical protein